MKVGKGDQVVCKMERLTGFTYGETYTIVMVKKQYWGKLDSVYILNDINISKKIYLKYLSKGFNTLLKQRNCNLKTLDI